MKIEETYVTPVETHNPIELHASVSVWDGSKFTLYETAQGVVNHRAVMAQVLGVPKENVQVISRFLGSQREQWIRAIEVFDEERGEVEQLKLFAAERRLPAAAPDRVGVRL